VPDLVKHSNKYSNSVKGTAFIEYLNDYWLLKRVSALYR
jgi:hypothetical protein